MAPAPTLLFIVFIELIFGCAANRAGPAVVNGFKFRTGRPAAVGVA